MITSSARKPHRDLSDYLVWLPEEGETEADAVTLIHTFADSAAEHRAAEWDRADSDYPIAANDGTLIVMTRDKVTGEEAMFRVTGYFDPVYSATRQEPPKEKECA